MLRSCRLHVAPQPLTLPRPRHSFSSRRPALPSDWEPVLDSASGKTYYWQRSTNQTSWTQPVDEASATQPPVASPASAPIQPSALAFPELAALLSSTQPVYLSKTIDGGGCREAAFSDAFTEYLTARVADAALSVEERERAEKLRARLANPLLRQPPPFV